MPERQVTFGPYGHVLTNVNVWSPDSGRIVYDVRSDAAGSTFDGARIETVDVRSGAVEVLYRSEHGSCCGVATFHPTANRVVFILGPEHPDADWQYGPAHRQGVVVDADSLMRSPTPLDARDLVFPFTPGALRGGSHVHVFHPAGDCVSFTYDDHVLSVPRDSLNPALSVSAAGESRGAPRDAARRNVGVAVVGRPVKVSHRHPRNHDGSAFSVLVTQTCVHPRPGSDDYGRAYEDAWIGSDGYVRADGTRQHRAIAFIGDVIDPAGRSASELFCVDLPSELTHPTEGPLEGTTDRLPYPPNGVRVRRLTRTVDRPFPGIQGVRHWVRSAPDGSEVATLMRDDTGVSQLVLVSPTKGRLKFLTRNRWDISSAFTWSPDGRWIAHSMDGSVCITSVDGGKTRRLTPKPSDATDDPLPLAVVFSPDGRSIAYQRRVPDPDDQVWNQVFVFESDGEF